MENNNSNKNKRDQSYSQTIASSPVITRHIRPQVICELGPTYEILVLIAFLLYSLKHAWLFPAILRKGSWPNWEK